MTDTKTAPPRINPIPNGPYKVTGKVDLRDPDGWQVTQEEEIYLCRCGRSGDKPFCDGTHKHNKFASKRQSDGSRDVPKNYAAGDLVIHDNRGVCARTGYCTKHAKNVFDPQHEPWIKPDGASPGKVMNAIKLCPSGALSYTHGGIMQLPEEREPRITMQRNGPYLVEGGVVLEGDFAPQSREHYALCRCGASKNKPFCDGSHRDEPAMDKVDNDPMNVYDPVLKLKVYGVAALLFGLTAGAVEWASAPELAVSRGFFGAAPLLADINLLLQLVLLGGLTFGAALARRGSIAAHKYNQTLWVMFNALLVALIMLPSLGEVTGQGAATKGYWIAWLHAVAGGVAVGGGIYLLLLMNRLLPENLSITWWKTLMRVVLASYWLVALLGLGSYYALYS